MNKQQHNNLIRVPKVVFLFCMLTGFIALVNLTGCEDKPVIYDVADYDMLIRFVVEASEGKEFFRTEGLIPDDPYTKPFRDTVYQDFVDSINRWYYITTTPDSLEKDLGDPYWVTDDAEVVVNDHFYIRTRKIHGEDTTEVSRQRLLVRIGYFLRLGGENQRFSGWMLVGFNGGKPRGTGLLEITQEDGSTFRGDDLFYQQYRYIKYTTCVHYDHNNIQDSIWVDTSVGYSRNAYVPLEDIALVTKGNELVFNSQADSLSVYQLISAETDDGFVLQVMHGPEALHYVDTLRTPTANERIWNIVMLREFRYPDIPGGIWCVPYKTR